jgi:tripartite ATP-independent transporter DctM subunit
MEWYVVLLIIFGMLIVFLLSGLPVAFAFIAVNFLAIFMFMGGLKGWEQVVPSAFNMLNSFILVPIALFTIMGAIVFNSGAGWVIIDALDKWIGKVKARLSILVVIAGTIFAAVSGVPMGTTAMLGSIFFPEMRKRGYSKEMSIGPIISGGGLAMIIPPSGMAVVLGGLAQASIGRLLISGFVPGLMLSAFYIAWVVFMAWRHPEQVPQYEAKRYTWGDRAKSLGYIIPLAGVVFLVTVVIYLGVATPTEAAATGALASFALVAVYKKFSWKAFKKTLLDSTQTTVMVMLIIIGSVTFSQLLAYTGSTAALARVASTLPLPPVLVVIAMQIVIAILGCFMDLISISMITIPIFMPVVTALNLDPIWFLCITLVNLSTATLTPPFGMLLFTLKGVAPPDVTMGDIIKGTVPFIVINFVGIALMIAFPDAILWLPNLMQ